MARLLQLRNGTLQEWTSANPILAEGELGVILGSSGNVVIGDGSTPYTKLHTHAWGLDAYDILVKDGAYKGTKEDFCRQLQSSLRISEQQAGVLSNAGPGWNSFAFPKEFTEECYVFLMPQDTSLHASVKNITKQGFQYCLFDSNDNTTDENVTINYLAVAVSDMDIAKAIATAAGLNPFDYDNLTTLFTDHAAEIVSNEAAFNLVKASSMASGKYLCYLIGLDPDVYDNMSAISANPETMDKIANNNDAIRYIQSSQVSSDSMKGSSMSTAKYVCGILMINPDNVSDMLSFVADADSVGVILANAEAMKAVANSKVSIMPFRDNSKFMQDMLDSDVSVGALASSKVAVSVFISNEISLMALVANHKAFDAIISKPENCRLIINNSFALDYVVNSKLAMEQIASNEVAINEFINHDIAVETISKSKIAMVEIAYNDNAMDQVVISDIALNHICNSDTAFSTITGRKSAIQKIANDKNAMEIVMSHEVSRDLFFLTDHCLGEGLVTYGEVGDDIMQDMESYPQYRQRSVLMRVPGYTSLAQYISNLQYDLRNNEKIARAFSQSKAAMKEWLSSNRDGRSLDTFTQNSLVGKYIIQDKEARTFFFDNELRWPGYALASYAAQGTALSTTSYLGRQMFYTSSSTYIEIIRKSNDLMQVLCNDEPALNLLFSTKQYDSYKQYYLNNYNGVWNILENPLSRSYFFKSPSYVALGLKTLIGTSASISDNYDIVSTFSSYPSTFFVHYKVMKYILKDDYALNYFFQYSYVWQGLRVGTKEINDSQYDSYSLGSIYGTQACMNLIKNNQRIMNIIARSPYAVNYLAQSYSSCMYYFTDSIIAVTAFMENLDTVNLFLQTKAYLGNVLATYIGTDHEDLNGNYTFEAILTKPNAIQIVVGHEGTMRAISASTYALPLMLQNDTALTMIMNSEVAMKAIAADERGVQSTIGVPNALTAILGDEMCANIFLSDANNLSLILSDDTAKSILLNSLPALTCIAKNNELLEVINNDEAAINEIVSNQDKLNIFVSDAVSTEYICASPIFRETVLSAEFSVGQLLSTYSGITAPDLIESYNLQLVVTNHVAINQLVSNKRIVDLIASSNIFIKAISKSSIAMEAIASNLYAVETIFENDFARLELLNSTYYLGTAIAQYNGSDDETLKSCNSISDIVCNVDVMRIVLNDIKSMQLVLTNQQALQLIIDNADVYDMVVHHKTAMQTIMNNQTAKELFLSANTNVGFGLTTYADSNSENIKLSQSLSEILNSNLACNDMLNDDKMCHIILSSPSALQAIMESTDVLELLASNENAMRCFADHPLAINTVFKSNAAKAIFALHNDILQSVSLRIAKTIRNNPKYFQRPSKYQFAYSYTSTTDYGIGDNYVAIVMSGSYYDVNSSQYSTIAHGFDKTQLITNKHWGNTEDEANTFIALGGVSITESSGGRNRIWIYEML